ncbi:MAG: DUF348 domain-containing protein [Faecalibacterium sp.]|nr:DUF348 domain-containing protein [Faecalibacterium sp.]
MLLILLLPLVFYTFSLNLVHVSDSLGASRRVITRHTDHFAILEKAGMQPQREDKIYYTAYNGDLAALSIQRAFEVTVQADGVQVPVKLTGGTVQQALRSAGITLGEEDYTEPGLSAELTGGETIAVHRVSYQDEVKRETVLHRTRVVQTSLLCRRPEKVVTAQKGIDGEKTTTIRHRYVDGQLESSQIVDITTTRESQDAIMKVYGEKVPVSSLTGPDGTTSKPTEYKQVLTGRATGYSSKGGKGSSGLGLGYGTVAVDPSVIPYGSLLYIESTDGEFVYGYAIATDTGTAMREGHVLVDLYYKSYAESVANGVFKVNVYVVE